MSDKDIVERLTTWTTGGGAGDTVMVGLLAAAAKEIMALRYQHERAVEEIAALWLKINQLQVVAGKAEPTSYREMLDGIPRAPRWPLTGVNE